jgi:hypothetical protein
MKEKQQKGLFLKYVLFIFLKTQLSAKEIILSWSSE